MIQILTLMGFKNNMGILVLLNIHLSASPAKSERITFSPRTLSICRLYFDYKLWVQFKAFSDSRTELVVSILFIAICQPNLAPSQNPSLAFKTRGSIYTFPSSLYRL